MEQEQGLQYFSLGFAIRKQQPNSLATDDMIMPWRHAC